MKHPLPSRILGVAVAIFLLASLPAARQASMPAAPATAKLPVSHDYHGTKVDEDYRWLENWDAAEVQQWSADQNARARAYLDNLPSRPAIKARIQRIIGGASPNYYSLVSRPAGLFAMKYTPPQQQPALVVLRSATDTSGERVVVDLNALSAKGSTAADFYVPSRDGALVAVALSENGSEDSSAHVFETASGKELGDRVPRVNFATAGGSISWKGDGSGFYYTRYPQGSERSPEDANFYQQVYFHKLGTDSHDDVYVIGKEFPRIAETLLSSSDDGKWLLASVANGDGGQYAHYVMDGSGHWTQVTHFDDGVVSAKLLANDALYLLSRKDAPRGKILRLPLADLQLANAKIVVTQTPDAAAGEEPGASIDAFVPTTNRLYVLDMIGGPSRLRVFDHEGHQIGTSPSPPVSSITGLVREGGDSVLFEVSSYLEPSAWYRFDAAGGRSQKTSLFQTSPIGFDDAEVIREFAVSRDSTRVPVNIIRRKGTALDGRNPVLLEGYGGYGNSMVPYFLGSFGRLWLDQGGVYVIANLRGGAEYGEEWHKAGNLTHKQNVFDDFVACAEHLVARKYTSPAHLAIMGGSNGGLLMGAAFTQRPDLFRAVVSFAGIYDMLRVELDPNGVFNTTEYGTVKDADQFKALYAYSPYHHVKDGIAYPSILFLTGENDHRVNPMQSRKMIARLQAANSSEHPVFLRTTSDAGHGFGTALDEWISQEADVFSFLFDQLGVSYKAAEK